MTEVGLPELAPGTPAGLMRDFRVIFIRQWDQQQGNQSFYNHSVLSCYFFNIFKLN